MSKLPEHLFSSDDGALYDTRVADWSKSMPLRAVYKMHCARINTAAEFKASLRAGGYSWPGGYPLYFVMADGESLSFKAAQENVKEILSAVANGNAKDWQPVALEINWEDSDLTCAHSGAKIESAYGETV